MTDPLDPAIRAGYALAAVVRATVPDSPARQQGLGYLYQALACWEAGLLGLPVAPDPVARGAARRWRGLLIRLLGGRV